MRETEMRKSHYLLFGVAAATLCLVVAGPVAASLQDEEVAEAAPPNAAPVEPGANSDKQATIAGWSAEKRTSYDAWPSETQDYYWTLTPKRQQLFWRLDDTDKIAITAMTGPERDAAWTQIEGAFGEQGEG